MTKTTKGSMSQHTKLTNHVPTQLPTGTGTTVHSPVVTVCNMECGVHRRR